MIKQCFQINSLRKRLIFFLFAIVFFVWAVTTLTSYISMKGQIEKFVDLQLVQFAHALVEIDFEQTQNYKPEISQEVQAFLKTAKDKRNLHYQIWKDGNLVLHSLQAPKEHIAFEQKFTDTVFEGKRWRVFTLIPYEDTKLHIEVLTDMGLYSAFITPLSEMVMLNQLAEFVLLALFLWFGVNAGLQPLQTLAKTIRKRDYKDLTPIEPKDVPDEIFPVIKALNDLFDRLQASFESEREFTSHAAHELRTPLAALKMQAQVAMREKNIKKQGQLLEKISSGVDRASHLVDQLLMLARVDADSEHLKFKALPLDGIVKSGIADLQDKATAKDIQVIFDQSPAQDVMGHMDALKILFRNILDNAINYSPEHSKVNVRIYEDSQHVYLSVTDQGPGIEESLREQVLKKFVRIPGSKAQGIGLGLAIVKKIVTLHSADLNLKYGPERKGLCVTVSFPKISA